MVDPGEENKNLKSLSFFVIINIDSKKLNIGTCYYGVYDVVRSENEKLLMAFFC